MLFPLITIVGVSESERSVGKLFARSHPQTGQLPGDRRGISMIPVRRYWDFFPIDFASKPSIIPAQQVR